MFFKINGLTCSPLEEVHFVTVAVYSKHQFWLQRINLNYWDLKEGQPRSLF